MREREAGENAKKFQDTGLAVCLGFSHESPYTREQPVQLACLPGPCDVIRCDAYSQLKAKQTHPIQHHVGSPCLHLSTRASPTHRKARMVRELGDIP